MATSDAELIVEVRSFTGYTSETFSDSDIQNVIDAAKEEIRSYIVESTRDPSTFDFFNNTRIPARRQYNAVRALFWFTCIGLKMRAGEIGGASLSLASLEQETVDNDDFQPWFDNLWRKLQAAQPTDRKGARSTQIARDGRTYTE